MARILVVEDEPAIADLLAINLRHAGHQVTLAADAVQARREVDAVLPDLVLLDWMLPGQDGTTLARRWRSTQRTRMLPIIMLTARAEEADKVAGLDAGADDYLAKPFNPRELLARIHAVLRRRGPEEAPGGPAQESQTVSFGDFVLDLSTRQLTRNGEPVSITTGEFAVMKAFARHPRVPLSREKLMEMARGREYEAFDRSLDVQISRLRKLIEVDPSKPKFIQTVWGLGYVFIPDGNG